MTIDLPLDRGERCSTCNQKLEPTTYGRHWKLTCECGEIPIKFAQKIPEGWNDE